MVMCDVGQGDALVLSTGPHEAVVVDAGPDPALVDRCLRRLDVQRIPAVLLTHFHADHVDGLPGVLEGRAVGEIEVDPLRLPAYGAEQVSSWAAAAHVPLRVPAYGERDAVGDVRWQVLAPRTLLSDSPNDASLVLLVRSHGIRLLLTGDIEPPSQGVLLHENLGRIDVLKVPHHGSRYQDSRLLTDLGDRVALVSVGVNNDYGHPDPVTMSLLHQSGALVRRTDRDGDIAVVVRDGRLSVVTRH
jgi:competence protein ComEC